MLALGTPEVAFGIIWLSLETFSPGTELGVCSVTVSESVLAHEVTNNAVAKKANVLMIKR